MKNFVQRGDRLTLTAPTGGVAAGKPVKVGAMVVVPLQSADEGALFEGDRVGVFKVTLALTADVVQGAKAYLKADGSAITGTATGNTLCGVFANDQVAADTSGDVLLTGQVA